MDHTQPSLTVNSAPRVESLKERRIKRIVTQRAEECAQLTEQIKLFSDRLGEYTTSLAGIVNSEMDAIEAEMEILVKRREKAKAHYEEYKKQVKDMGEDYLSPLKERLEHLERLNRMQYSLTAPVNKLPVELLGYIFKIYVDMGNGPWVLILVGPVWREVAMSTPKLWRHILVTNQETLAHEKIWNIGGDIGDVKSHGRYAVCRNNAELISILPLSKKASLRIVLRLSGRINSPWEDPESTPLVSLFGEATSQRLKKIDFNLNGNGSYLPSSLSSYMEDFSYPILKDISIDVSGSNWDMAFMSNILASPKLTRVVLKSPIPTEAITSPGWKSVHHLFIQYVPEHGSLNQLCDKLYNLRTLEGCAKGWPGEDTPKTAFAYLNEMTLSSMPSHLHRLTLPSLIKLQLDTSGWVPPASGLYSPWIFPVLSELHLSLGSPGPTYLPHSTSMPVLRAMTVFNCGSCHSLPPVVYPSVLSVRFEGCGSTSYFASAFSMTPNAQKVTFTASRYDKSTIMNALQQLIDTTNIGAVTIPLPFASEFYFGSSGTPAASKARTHPLIKQFIANRLSVARPLAVLDAVWRRNRIGEAKLESYIKKP
ncbi:hypothetical protein FRC17_003864 [Serendipita sp. 399]|nr:hypothetical protein FRC17_003864 [Serendipita sp. 399]